MDRQVSTTETHHKPLLRKQGKQDVVTKLLFIRSSKKITPKTAITVVILHNITDRVNLHTTVHYLCQTTTKGDKVLKKFTKPPRVTNIKVKIWEKLLKTTKTLWYQRPTDIKMNCVMKKSSRKMLYLKVIGYTFTSLFPTTSGDFNVLDTNTLTLWVRLCSLINSKLRCTACPDTCWSWQH